MKLQGQGGRFVSQPLISRFYEKFKVASNGCWMWTGNKRDRYGQIRVGKTQVSAHRVSYKLHKGNIPKGLLVRHTCDTPLCVNPDHLLLGTVKDNSHDAKLRKRNVFGEKQGHSVLTDKLVIQMRNMYTGQYGQIKQITEKLSVPYQSAWKAIKGKSWNHLPLNSFYD